MQENQAEPPSASATDQLRRLARHIAETPHEDPRELDELAHLAMARARAVREEQHAARAARIARIRVGITDAPAAALDALPDRTLAMIDALLDQAAAATARQQHLKAEMLKAGERDEYDQVGTLADAARDARVASDAALQQARQTLQTITGNPTIASDQQSAPSPPAASESNLTTAPIRADAVEEATPDIAHDTAPDAATLATPENPPAPEPEIAPDAAAEANPDSAHDTPASAAMSNTPENPEPPEPNVAPDTVAEATADATQGTATCNQLEALPSPEPDTPPALEQPETPPQLKPAPHRRAPPGADCVWTALREQRLGLAYALITAGALGADTPAIFAPTLKLATAALIADGTGTMYDDVGNAAEEVLTVWSDDQSHTEFGQAVLALLLPTLSSLAILTPGAFTSGLMRTVLATDIDVPALLPLRELARIADQSQAQLGHATGLLASLVSEEYWQTNFTRFAAETDAWWRAQNNSQVRFAAATDVWRHMLRPEQTIGRWLQKIVSREIDEVTSIRSEINRFDFEKELRRLEPLIRSRTAARRNPIEGPAFQLLCKLGNEAIERVRNWLTLLDRRPLLRRPEQDGHVVALRNAFRDGIAAARHTLDVLTPPTDAGAGIVRRMLDRLEALLAAETLPPESDRIDERIGRELLACSGLRMTVDWQLLTPIGPDVLPDLLALAANPPPTPRTICATRLHNADFIGAMLTLRLASDDTEAATLRDDIDQAFTKATKAYRGALDAAQRDIETAERAGRLDAGPAQEWLAGIEDIRDRLKSARPDQFEGAEACLEEARKITGATQIILDEAKENARQRIKLRLERLIAAPADRASITQALDDGQFAVAEDLVDRLEAGEPIDAAPLPTVESVFDAFFPARNRSLAGWRSAHGPVLRDFAASSLAIPPGQETAAEDLAACVNAWTSCASEPFQQLLRSLPLLLRQLGFTEPELVGAQTPKSGATEAMFRLRARPLRERGTSVLPEFGSSANGSYALLCLWKKRDVQVITEALARQLGSSGPTIVLFFAPLDPIQRRNLGTLARNGSLRSTIVIDELLALHLASLATGRLTALFACTLPFTDTQPWAETGTPPPEMFFGRQLELRDVETLDGGGAHLIYGGRQLGKTALLRQVERNGDGNASTIACYVSIAQLGVASEVRALWTILTDELSRRGVVFPMKGADPARAFATAVRNWLNDVPARRIILLLDEADEFFRNDREGSATSAPFAVTRALSELANNTSRRFKPVFAGLRNVQKLARDPNSPLAHLGTPRVIGPLMRGQERRHAEQLVRWPFSALGYRLSDEVVTRILAFANYYPSLIQVVCQRLLRGVRERQGNAGPPWDVTMEQVAAVLETRDLRAATYERFRITLELDQRYLLITLVMAELSRDNPHMLAAGIDAHELREYAASVWPEGFPADFSDDAFDALLSEMVGLGLLRDIHGTHFALRSANLAHLIGSAEKIKADIAAFYNRPAPPEADPAQARRAIAAWPSLLTSQQEGVLLSDLSPNRRSTAAPGCIVLGGIALAHIASAETAIRTAVEASKKLPAHEQISISNVARVDPSQIGTLVARRADAARPAIWIIKPDTEWTAETVAAAASALAALPPRSVPTRLVFIADAARAWDWCGAPGRQALLEAEDPRARVGELSAGPWSRTALDLWLKEHTELTLPPEEILARTGGWDRAIHALRRNSAFTSQDLIKPRTGPDPLADLQPLGPAMQVLQALQDILVASSDTELVNEQVIATWDDTLTRPQIACALAWAQLIGAVQPGRGGLELNPLLRAALPLLAAP